MLIQHVGNNGTAEVDEVLGRELCATGVWKPAHRVAKPKRGRGSSAGVSNPREVEIVVPEEFEG
jgi:hypothetical protein